MEWEAIGKIIAKECFDTKYFPVILSKTFVSYIRFGTVDTKNLISSFFIVLV